MINFKTYSKSYKMKRRIENPEEDVYKRQGECMLQDRREKIIELLYEKRMLKASELVGMFNVSLETIRRDLEALEEKGYLERVYGGAVSKQKKGLEPEYEMREVKNYREKLAIAEKAVEFVENGDVLFIDIGTTTLEFAKALLRKRAVTVRCV